MKRETFPATARPLEVDNTIRWLRSGDGGWCKTVLTDDYGRHCAVGRLMVESGIPAENKNVWQMKPRFGIGFWACLGLMLKNDSSRGAAADWLERRFPA